MSDRHGMVWWSELMTRDVDAAVKYYSDVCGWTFETMEMEGESGTYYVAKHNDQPVAGIMDMSIFAHLEKVPPHWFTYFAVDDVDATVAATKAEGGSLLREPFEIPGTGRIAILEDPTGAAMGMMTPDFPG